LNLFKRNNKNEKVDSDFISIINSSDNRSLILKEKIEKWFEKVPDKEKKRLKKDIQSEDNHIHWSGFFELYLHELFIQAGYEIICHKKNEDSKRMPDFYLKNKKHEFYVEAITRSDSSSIKKRSKRQNTVVEFFNSLEITKDIIVKIIAIPYRKPETILRELENEIKDHIFSLLTKPIDFKEKYDLNGWEIEFTIASDYKEKKRNCHLIGPIEKWTVYDYISSAVENKHPTNYKIKNDPFIIAINIHPMNTKPIDKEQICDAIYGLNIQSQFNTTWDGAFIVYDETNKKHMFDNEDISGLLVIDNLDFFTIDYKRATLYINPGAKNPVSSYLLPIDSVYYDTEKKDLVFNEGKGNKELFGL